MAQSKFRITVPQKLYDAVCDRIGQPFADSYLFGATLEGNTLTPRTAVGYDRMVDRTDFMRLLEGLGVMLARPKPWRPDSGRASSDDTW